MTNYPLDRAIGGGFIAFGLCGAFGLRILYRGIRNDVLDSSGTPLAGRSWFVVGGILLMLPLIGYTFFVWRQGYFGSWNR